MVIVKMTTVLTPWVPINVSVTPGTENECGIQDGSVKVHQI